jgi:hypothetical protein
VEVREYRSVGVWGFGSMEVIGEISHFYTPILPYSHTPILEEVGSGIRHYKYFASSL